MNTTSQSKHPETDAEQCLDDRDCDTWIAFARTIEQQRDEALALLKIQDKELFAVIIERDSLKEQLKQEKIYAAEKNHTANGFMNQVKKLQQENQSLISQMAVMVEALNKLVEFKTPMSFNPWRAVAQKALNSIPLAAKEFLERLDWYKIEYEALKSVINQCLEAMGPTNNVCLREAIMNQREKMKRMWILGNDLVECITSSNKHGHEIQNAISEWRGLSTSTKPTEK